MRLRCAKLDKPLFFASKNFKEYLDVKATPGLELTYEEDKNRIRINYVGKVAYILNVTNIAVEPLEGNEKYVEPISSKGANTKVKAQVSHPHGIVE